MTEPAKKPGTTYADPRLTVIIENAKRVSAHLVNEVRAGRLADLLPKK